MKRYVTLITVFAVISCFSYSLPTFSTYPASSAVKEKTVRCWRCHKSFTVPAGQRKGHCPHCGAKFVLPPATPIPTPRPIPTPSPIPGTEPAKTPRPPEPESISWRDGGRYAGQTKSVKGNIVGSIISHGSGNLYLNFDPDYKTYLSIKVAKENLSKFPPNPVEYYKGKTVIATGQIVREKNLRLIVTKPEDLIIIK